MITSIELVTVVIAILTIGYGIYGIIKHLFF